MKKSFIETPPLPPTAAATSWCNNTVHYVGVYDPGHSMSVTPPMNEVTKYKYSEDRLLEELKNYIDKTYVSHYVADEDIQCLDAWIALGDSIPTFRNTAMKYLWRVGKKGDEAAARKDVMKAIHYCMFILHVMDKK